MEFELGDIKQTVVVDIRDNAVADRVDKQRAEDRKQNGLPMEYYCKSFYWPEKGLFFTLPKCIGNCYTGITEFRSKICTRIMTLWRENYADNNKTVVHMILLDEFVSITLIILLYNYKSS
ncbi:hypothetical protein AQUCO_02500117v1 [Aquilegia coerulea]|uniref:Uncharacterized protein n=1 Tax=Aquilegia coerulea TaxID=218851 RepID=A0A2G5D9M8_AQUCA|nr:hypothetical protein AQUCO_02500117v1 [Aquilegia coerulea]